MIPGPFNKGQVFLFHSFSKTGQPTVHFRRLSPLLGYYFMSKWLQSYSYRTSLSWWIFAATGSGALLITLLTVSYQAIKAALANPVKSLRTE
ncbi:hypothetical protein A4D02_14600 [Niastella koreensis]|uniref:ABC transporter permease n=1 Tax=Niastella koreensis TaxID=354356 RepID=A0ABX3NN08_9BACT|nr:hypothetical protein [Niastella koreensis]OQP40158.1 hypothetical protein A4D02_14600 [Niastella koreensis]